MRMLFRQRLFSWFDSYDIYDETENTLYTVQGKLAWGHCLKIFDAGGREVGMVKQRVLTFLPKFELWQGDTCLGCISRELTFLIPRYYMDFNGWHIEGTWAEWDYTIIDANGNNVATVSKELFHLTDTYVIDVARPDDALCALMFTLAVDAEKCSRS